MRRIACGGPQPACLVFGGLVLGDVPVVLVDRLRERVIARVLRGRDEEQEVATVRRDRRGDRGLARIRDRSGREPLVLVRVVRVVLVVELRAMQPIATGLLALIGTG